MQRKPNVDHAPPGHTGNLTEHSSYYLTGPGNPPPPEEGCSETERGKGRRLREAEKGRDRKILEGNEGEGMEGMTNKYYAP